MEAYQNLVRTHPQSHICRFPDLQKVAYVCIYIICIIWKSRTIGSAISFHHEKDSQVLSLWLHPESDSHSLVFALRVSNAFETVCLWDGSWRFCSCDLFWLECSCNPNGTSFRSVHLGIIIMSDMIATICSKLRRTRTLSIMSDRISKITNSCILLHRWNYSLRNQAPLKTCELIYKEPLLTICLLFNPS